MVLNSFVTWWRHQMEPFSALLAFCAGKSPVTSEFPSQSPVTRSFNVFFDLCLKINGWVNNHEAGDLRPTLWNQCIDFSKNRYISTMRRKSNSSWIFSCLRKLSLECYKIWFGYHKLLDGALGCNWLSIHKWEWGFILYMCPANERCCIVTFVSH